MTSNSKKIVRRRLVRSYVTSVISISMVLFLVACAAIFAANAGNISRYFKENMTVSVILKQSTSDQEARSLSSSLSKKEYVRCSRYVSKEEGAKEMKVLLGEDFLNVFASSPIPISIDLNLDGNAITSDSLAVIKREILANSLVDDVVYQDSLVDALNANLERISIILLAVIVVLMVISFALISNTVRLNIYARRFTIHTMSLVGAKRSFIARPFILQAVIQGFVSGFLACGLMVALLYFANDGSEILKAILDMNLVIASLAFTVLLGVVLCVISALIVVNKVAYISKDDLYY